MQSIRITLATLLLLPVIAEPLAAQFQAYSRSPRVSYVNRAQQRQPPARRIYSSWPGYVPVASPEIVQVSQQQTMARPVMQSGGSVYLPRTFRMTDFSLLHDRPTELKKHDLVTIVVDEKSELQRNQKFNRQRNAQLLADLKEFIRLGPTGNLVPAAANNPKIDATLQNVINTTGQVTDTEGIKYRIAATVVDVYPNGTLVLEAKKVIQTQDGESTYKLTGLLRAQDVGPDNTASSENIANLNIVKQQAGRVYDSTKRSRLQRLLDLINPL